MKTTSLSFSLPWVLIWKLPVSSKRILNQTEALIASHFSWILPTIPPLNVLSHLVLLWPLRNITPTSWRNTSWSFWRICHHTLMLCVRYARFLSRFSAPLRSDRVISGFRCPWRSARTSWISRLYVYGLVNYIWTGRACPRQEWFHYADSHLNYAKRRQVTNVRRGWSFLIDSFNFLQISRTLFRIWLGILLRVKSLLTDNCTIGRYTHLLTFSRHCRVSWRAPSERSWPGKITEMCRISWCVSDAAIVDSRPYSILISPFFLLLPFIVCQVRHWSWCSRYEGCRRRGSAIFGR